MLRAVAHSCIIVMAKLSLSIMYRLIRLYCWFAGGHNTIGTAIIRINIVQQHVVCSRSWTVSPKGAGFCCQAMIFRSNANPFFLVPSVFFLLFLPWSATAVGCWYVFYTSVRASVPRLWVERDSLPGPPSQVAAPFCNGWRVSRWFFLPP